MANLQQLSNDFDNEPYMSQQQLSYFKNKLLHWRNELSSNLERAVQLTSAGAENAADWVDTASQQTQAELSRVNCEHSLHIMQEIDDALKRIKLGTYGFCIETGEEIGIRRLVAMPIAKYTIEAQEAQEANRSKFR
ncbi:MAG: TraR/DksA C4-type zinc finger protein [Desulfuromonadales bacterium]|jgi:DnaK suppressor protein